MVFFSSLFFICCTTTTKLDYTLNLRNNKIYSISFFGKNTTNYKIVLKNKQQPILGDYTISNNALVFTPVVPLSANTTYQIKEDKKILGEFIIEKPIDQGKSELLHIYPKKDTVPENLLKMYLIFSKPMQEVKNALDYIKVIDNKTQKEVAVFLPLETELWNKDHTELTLWLDPGRIKKDLIPNKTLGTPLFKGRTYSILIDKKWTDAKGNRLLKDYKKIITVTLKDTEKPSIDKIKISQKLNDYSKININFRQDIDVMLINKNITILNDNKERVEGEFSFVEKKNQVLFIPNRPFKKGDFTLQIQSSLEDLAGNNFNRLFDTDLQIDTIENKKFRSIPFTIQ